MKAYFIFLAGVSAISCSVAAQAQVEDNSASTPATADASGDTESDDGSRLGEITVTARRSNENQQKVPVAVSVIAPAQIASQGDFNAFSLPKFATGFNVAPSAGDRTSLRVVVRGQTQTFQTLFPAVIPYFAEVPLPTVSSGTFYDLANVQVLRGAQGTRFGRVTDGGAFLLTPAMPKDDFGGYIEGRLGDYDYRQVRGAINIPIIEDKILFRGSFDINRRKGYTKNLLSGRNLDNVNYETGRAIVTLRPVEGFENTTIYQHLNLKSNGPGASIIGIVPEGVSNSTAGFGPEFGAATLAALQAALAQQQLDGPRRVRNGNAAYGSDYGLRDRIKSNYLINTTSLEVTDSLKAKMILSYVDYSSQTGTDLDGSSLQYLDSINRFVPFVNQQQITGELQLAGKLFDALSFTTGVYVDQQKDQPQARENLIFGIVNQSTTQIAKTTSAAVYGNLEYDLSNIVEGLKLSGGVRRTWDTVKACNLVQTTFTLSDGAGAGICAGPDAIDSSASFRVWTYEGGVSYQAAPNALIYYSRRRGYRPGGFNPTRAGNSQLSNRYQPEFTNENELGGKFDYSIFGMEARTNIAVYYNKLKSLQKFLSILDDGPTPLLVTGVVNSADATVYGAEFEGQIAPTDGLKFGLNYAYTHARYERDGFTNDQLFGPTGACNRDATVNIGFCPLSRFQSTPEHQFTLSANYEFDVGESTVGLGANYTHQSSIAFNDPNYLSRFDNQRAYGVLDLTANYDNAFGMPLDFSAFVTNVTNKTYKVSTTATDYPSTLGFISALYGPPRMFGVGVKYRFGSDR